MICHVLTPVCCCVHTGLTRLHLGRLPAKKPPSGLQLPSVKRLTLHLKHTALFPGDDVPNWVATQHRDMVEGLVGERLGVSKL